VMLYLDSILLMWLKVGPIKNKKVTDVISSVSVSSHLGGLIA
jgi:hypothetical protein